MPPDSLWEIERDMESNWEELERLNDEMLLANIELANAVQDHKVKFAQKRIEIRHRAAETHVKITADAVDDEATVATADEQHRAMLAANNVATLKEAIRTRISKSDDLRTMTVTHRNSLPA